MEVTFRDTVESDFEFLERFTEDEWKFTLYSKENGLAMSRHYLMHCINGSNVARTVLADGKVSGIIVLRDMPGDTIDISDEEEALFETFRDDKGCEEYMADMERLYGAYRGFAEKYKCQRLSELRLLIISRDCRGAGIGRRTFMEAERISEEHGMDGMFFYTDTDCNVDFYDHIGCERVGECTVICCGVNLDVFGYRYVPHPSQNKR